MSIERELTRIKEKLDSAKDKKIKLEGQREQLLSQLKEKFGISSIEEAKKLLIKKEKKILSMKKELEDGLTEFEEEFSELLEDF